jgi:hypothetical protein
MNAFKRVVGSATHAVLNKIHSHEALQAEPIGPALKNVI